MTEEFETAELREDEGTDDDAHARRNAEMLRLAREELDRFDKQACDSSDNEQEGDE